MHVEAPLRGGRADVTCELVGSDPVLKWPKSEEFRVSAVLVGIRLFNFLRKSEIVRVRRTDFDRF